MIYGDKDFRDTKQGHKRAPFANRSFFVPLILLMAVLTGCSHRDSKQRIPEVRVALNQDGITWHPVRLAQARFAAEEGISIKISEVAGGSKGMEALLGRSVDVTSGMLPDALQVAAQGRDVRCFLFLNSRPTMTLVVAPAMADKIHTIRDLKGRHVGVSSPGSTTHQFLNFLLATNGMNPADVGVVSVGIASTAIAALEHGKVDAAVLVGATLGTFERRYPKLKLLADTRTEEGTKQLFGEGKFPFASLIAREEWLQSDPETARRFARAVKKAMQWISTQSAEQVRETIPESLRMPDADADLTSIRLFQQTMTPDGTPPGNPEIVRRFVAVSDERVRNANLDLSKICTKEFAGAR
jgi:NitT/TauT family transport system substrate-binding protein